jgi:hypothetical protein
MDTAKLLEKSVQNFTQGLTGIIKALSQVQASQPVKTPKAPKIAKAPKAPKAPRVIPVENAEPARRDSKSANIRDAISTVLNKEPMPSSRIREEMIAMNVISDSEADYKFLKNMLNTARINKIIEQDGSKKRGGNWKLV